MKHLILPALFIVATSLFLIKNITVPQKKVRNSQYACQASDNDAQYAFRQKQMLADPQTGQIPQNIRQQELAFYNSAIVPFQKNTRAQNWNAVGPYNVGGRTRAAALDVTNENIILAAGVSGGIWRSINSGASWTRVSNELGYLGAVSISQDKRTGFENIWYAATGELSGNSASGGGAYYLGDGVFKSIDSGKSWQPISSTASGVPGNSISIPQQVAWSIATHPAMDSSRVFLSTYGGILRSVDAGNTWAWVLGSLNNGGYYSNVKITTTGIVYATLSSDGSPQGFFRSADNGITWANITPTSLLAGHDRTVMDINPNNENEVYFFSYLIDSLSPGGTLTSNYKGAPEYISLLKYTYLAGDGTDTNGAWLNLSNNLPNNANVTTGPFDKLNCQGGYDMLVKVQPTTGALIIGGTNLFYSSNAFATANNWKQIGGYAQATTLPYFQIWPNHHPDNHDVIFYPSNYNKVLCASDGGVHVTNDVTTATPVAWQSLNNGYLTTQPYTVTLDPSAGNTWLLGGFQDNGNFVTTNYNNANQSWVMPLNGDGAFNYIAPNNAFVLMSIQEGRIGKFNLDANGNKLNFRRIDPIGPTADDYTFINPFVVDANNNNFMYVPAGKKLYRQNDLQNIALTNTWDSISQGWFALSDTIKTLNISGRPAQIVSIAVSKNNPANMVYLGTNNREIYRIDNANTGNPVMVNLTKSPLSAGYVSSIAVDPSNGGNVLVCYSNYGVVSLFYSIDSGRVWRYCGGNLDRVANFSGAAPSIRWVDIMTMPDGKPKYFCGTSIGLYSTDSLWGTTVFNKDTTKWTQESINGIGTTVVNHITHRAADYTVAISTHGNGCYWGSYAYPTAITNSKPNVQNYDIQIYPNPSNNIANLNVQIYKEANCKITLVDAFGRKIQTIANGEFMQGKQSFKIATNNLSNGNYFVILESKNANTVSKQFTVLH